MHVNYVWFTPSFEEESFCDRVEFMQYVCRSYPELQFPLCELTGGVSNDLFGKPLPSVEGIYVVWHLSDFSS